MPKSKGRRKSSSTRKGPVRHGSPAKRTQPTAAGISKTAITTKKQFPPYLSWHRPLGWSLVVMGVLIAVLNDLAFVDIRVMPGGHSELYLMLGIAVAAGGAYFLGAFSRD